MIYFVVLAILAVCVSTQVFLVRKLGIAGLVNNPVSLLIVFFEIIHLLVPVLQWYQGYFRYSNNYDEYLYILSIIIAFFLFIFYSFFFILYLNYFTSTKKHLISIDTRNSKIFLSLTSMIFFIGFYFSFGNIISIQSAGYENYLSDRIGFSEGSGYKVIFAHWVYVSCILFYVGYLVGNLKRIFFFAFIISLIYCFIYYGLNSNRNSLFILVINLIVFYIYLSKSKRKNVLGNTFKLTIVGFSIYIFYLIGKFRNTAFSSVEVDYGLSRSLNGAFGNHENIVWLISNDFNYLWAKTYLAGFLNLIPRFIWAEKPFGAGPELKNMIYPGSYVIGQEGNSSLTTGLLTESIMNFGVLGSLPALFLISILVVLLLRYFKNLKNPFGIVIYIYLFTLLSTQFLYAEFLGFYTRTLFTSVPIFLLLFFVKFQRKV